MTFTAWRIVKRRHIRAALDGSGARKYGGRWNSPGRAVVYTAQSQSLAALEVLVHLDAPLILVHQYVLIAVEIDELLVSEVERRTLPRNWRATPAPPALQSIGNEWVRSLRSAVLQVPSALVPGESNFLLNPGHPDFRKLRFGEPISFQFDPRLAE